MSEAKKLGWRKVQPERPVGEIETHEARIAVLKIHSGNMAYFAATKIGGQTYPPKYEAQLWHGNVCGWSKRCNSIEEAKSECQNHLQSLIKENSQ